LSRASDAAEEYKSEKGRMPQMWSCLWERAKKITCRSGTRNGFSSIELRWMKRGLRSRDLREFAGP